LMRAAKAVDAMEAKMNPRQFPYWLNARVPARAVPWYALIPIVDAEWFYYG